MTKLFGVDISKELAKAMGPGLLPLKLVKTTQGARDSAALTEGPRESVKTYPCKGIIDDFQLSQFDGDLVQYGDRKVLILGGTLPSGVVPSAKDFVEAEGKRSEVVRILARDPAAATYLCQVRGA